MSDPNPYAPSQLPAARLERYAITRFPEGVLSAWLSWRRGWREHLQKLVDEAPHDGRRLIGALNSAEGGLIWALEPAEGPEPPGAEYRVSPLSVRPARLLPAAGRSWASFVSQYLPEFAYGWRLIAYCPPAGFVLRRDPNAQLAEAFAECHVVHLPPVWWRTLFGNSHLAVTQSQLNALAQAGWELVASLGDNVYLFGKRPEPGPAASFRLQLCDGWEKIAIQKPEAVFIPWLSRMAEEGWHLVAHNNGAIFLLRQRR